MVYISTDLCVTTHGVAYIPPDRHRKKTGATKKWCMVTPWVGVGSRRSHSTIVTPAKRFQVRMLFDFLALDDYDQCLFHVPTGLPGMGYIVGLDDASNTQSITTTTQWKIGETVCCQFRDAPHVFAADGLSISVLDLSNMQPQSINKHVTKVCDADRMRGYFISDQNGLCLFDWTVEKSVFTNDKQPIRNLQRSEDTDTMIVYTHCPDIAWGRKICLMDTRCNEQTILRDSEILTTLMLTDTELLGLDYRRDVVCLDMRTLKPIFTVRQPKHLEFGLERKPHRSLTNMRVYREDGGGWSHLFAYLDTAAMKPKSLVLEKSGEWRVTSPPHTTVAEPSQNNADDVAGHEGCA